MIIDHVSMTEGATCYVTVHTSGATRCHSVMVVLQYMDVHINGDLRFNNPCKWCILHRMGLEKVYFRDYISVLHKRYTFQ